jgi:hypothetical protein
MFCLWLTLQSHFPLQCSRIADDAPDEAIVLRVCVIPQTFCEPVVEMMFVRERRRPVRHVDSQALESRRGNEDQQSRIRNPILGEIAKPLVRLDPHPAKILYELLVTQLFPRRAPTPTHFQAPQWPARAQAAPGGMR